MTSQPVEANVVLTADTSGYDASMQGSAAQTEQLGKSVDSLTQKLDRLAKSAGKKLLGFAAADLAGITAATAAYGSFEKQMESLSAQAAVLNRTVEGQKRTFTEYGNAVNGLRAQFGSTTSEAAQLVQTISKLGDNTRPISNLAETFTKLSAVTGEPASNLAAGMLQLSRTMGTSDRDVSKYANTLTSLSASTAASASSILDFSQQIAPVGRLINLTQTEIMGVSTAFIKAGQDGYQAGNAFNKIVQDIAYATQSGSPDLAKYANLVGVTVSQFKEMAGSEQITRVFDSINRQGPKAITTLNQMGLDGMRTVRAITAMSSQTGGIGSAISQARAAGGDQSLDRGAKAAMDGLFDSMKRLRQEGQMTAEEVGSVFAPMATAFVDTLDTMAGAVRSFMGGPFGKMATVIAGVAAPFAALAGTILLASKALLAFSTLKLVSGSSLVRGFQEGRSGDDYIGRRIDANGNFIQRPLYGMGAMVGRQFAGGGGGGPNILSRTAGYMGAGAGFLLGRGIGDQYSPSWYNPLRANSGLDDPTMRRRLFNQPTLSAYVPERMRSSFADFRATNPAQGRLSALGMYAGTRLGAMGAYMSDQANLRNLGRGGLDILRDPKGAGDRLAAAFGKTADAAEDSAKKTRSFGTGMSSLTRGMGQLMGSMGMSAMGAGATAGRLAGRGIMSAGNALLGGPWGMALAGGLAGVWAVNKMRDTGEYNYTSQAGMMSPYYAAGGMQAPSNFNANYLGRSGPSTAAGARRQTQGDILQGTSSRYELQNQQIKGKSRTDAMAMLAPQFGGIKNNPKSIQMLQLDLINQYGPGAAEDMLNQLWAGDAFKPGDLMSTAMNKPRAHWYSGSKEDKGEVSGAMMNLAGAYSDERDFIAQTQGATAAMEALAQQAGDALGMFTRQAGREANPFIDPNTGATVDPRATERVAFGQMFAKEFLSTDITEEQAAGLRMDPSAKTSQDQLRSFLRTNVFGKDAVFSDQQQEDILNTYKVNIGKTGEAAADAVFEALINPIEETSKTLEYRIDQMKGLRDPTGRQYSFFDTTQVNEALDQPENVNAQITAIRQMYTSMVEAGKTAPEITRLMGNVKALAGTATSSEYQLAGGVQQYAQRMQGYQLAGAGRVETFRAQTANFQAATQIKSGDEAEAANLESAADTYFQQMEGQRQYFVQLLTQQREFNVMRSRAEEDFAQQRSRMDYNYNLQRSRAAHDFHQQQRWQLQDFNLQRSRAEDDFQLQQRRGREDYNRGRRRQEQDYNRQKERGEEDFNRNIRRARRDFHKSRMRQEEDYQHQVEQMTKQMAQSFANIYERIETKRTNSANWLLFNSQQQLDAMQKQAGQLDQLRSMGVSDDVIQQLDLTNPENAQQLARFTADLINNPELVAKFNASVEERLKAAKTLVTDESSATWEEFTRQFKVNRDRAQEDFSTSVKRQREDFARGVDRMDRDFERSMNRQAGDFERATDRAAKDFEKMMNRNATDFETAMNRASIQFGTSMSRMATDYDTATSQMAEDYDKSMTRAEEDLDRHQKTINGNFTTILEKAVKDLGGHGRTQAQAVLESFQGLRASLEPEAIALMESLADIFGVEYDPPKKKGGHSPKDKTAGGAGQRPGNTGGDTKHGGGGKPIETRGSAGTVLPGYNPTVDNHTFHSETAGSLHLSGGEAIMVPEFVKQVGGEGGVQELNRRARAGERFWLGGVLPLKNGSVSQHGAGSYYTYAADMNYPGYADYGKPVGAWKSGTVAQKNYIGDSSYGRWVIVNHGGQSSLYAHLSKFGAPSVGDKVSAGQTIGYVGDLGNTGSPPTSHLHFEIRGGAANYSDTGDGGGGGKSPGSGELAPEPKKVTKFSDWWESKEDKINRIAGKLKGINPFKETPLSDVLKPFAKERYQAMKEKYRNSIALPTTGANPVKHNYSPTAPAPTSLSGNKAIGQARAASRGWTGPQWDSLHALWMQESGWNHTADNPTSSAYGIPQALIDMHQMPRGYYASKTGSGASTQGYGGDPRVQIDWGLNYIAGRYGNPVNAWNFHKANNWYGDGAIFDGGAQTIGVGERGPEMVLPLNENGAEFISNLMRRISSGNDAKNRNTWGHGGGVITHNMHSYQIDKSTTFTGAIHVQANDPAQLVSQLQRRARTAALQNAAKGGVKIP